MISLPNKLRIICFAIFLTFACKQQESLKKVSIDQQLTNVAKSFDTDSGTAIKTFCDIIPIKDWDEVVVAAPYTTAENIKQENITNIDRVNMSILNFNDGQSLLIYLKEKKAIAYSIVSRAPVDFSNNWQPNIYRFKKTQCSSVSLKKDKYGRLSILFKK